MFIPAWSKYKNKRPPGRLQIDYNNDLVKNLRSLIIPTGAGAIDLVNQVLIPANGATASIIGKNTELVCSNADTTSNFEKVFTANLIEASDSFTVFARAYSTLSDTDAKRVVTYAQSGPSTNNIFLNFGVGGLNRIRASAVLSGASPVADIVFAPLANTFYNVAFTRKTGEDNTWLAALDGATKSVNTGTPSTASFANATNAVAICATINNNTGLQGGVALTALWRGFVDQDFLNELTEYPYQLLKPVRTYFILPSHELSGALVGSAPVMTGSFTHAAIVTHNLSGALVGAAPVITGAFDHAPENVTHDLTGALVGSASVVTGSLARATPGINHALSGDLIAGGPSVVTGSLTHIAHDVVIHDLSGDLIVDGTPPVVTGAFERPFTEQPIVIYYGGSGHPVKKRKRITSANGVFDKLFNDVINELFGLNDVEGLEDVLE